ncbi:MAG: T9SS type A sorting domain-containing protein [Bacteroidales bacterium]|nr:T9SS type A sorting domain-containing protein [Bacteroidales bacterium]
MKKLLVLNPIFWVYLNCFGQILSPETILSSGGEFANSSAQISWTLGDFQTTTYVKDQLVLTQGFLQSEIKVTAIFDINQSEDIELKVYPNPVTNYLYLKVISPNSKKLSWQLINQNGKLIKYDDIYNRNTAIDFSVYKDGVYYLKTFSKDGSFIKIFKIIRVN